MKVKSKQIYNTVKESDSLTELANDITDIKSLCSRNDRLSLSYDLNVGSINKLKVRIFYKNY